MKQTVKTSRAAGQLEKMFRALNTRFFDGKLPEPVITLKKTPGAYGHITCGKRWICPKCRTIIRSTKEVRVICADCNIIFIPAD